MSEILLVEDNLEIMNMNATTLSMYGYEVLCAESLKQADKLLTSNEPDMIVLDIMLPDGNGLDWCKKIKERRSIPVLFLSALNESADIVAGLRAGGDDYLPKPYNLDVLLARIEARLRSATKKKDLIYFGDIMLDVYSNSAFCKSKDLRLTKKEFSVLCILAENSKNKIGISKENLYERVWGQPFINDSNALWTTISRLKAKLEEQNSDCFITFSKAEGYLLEK